MSNEGASMEMPRYQCHKQVWALKIKAVRWLGDVDSSRAELEFEDERYAPREVSSEYVRKHRPAVGGYMVVYDDGYESWSPADTFESGYTLIPR
jgi:hypothetical protein